LTLLPALLEIHHPLQAYDKPQMGGVLVNDDDDAYKPFDILVNARG
jgi:hypothetical protein